MRPDSEQIGRAEALWSLYAGAVGRALMSYERDPELRRDLLQNVFIAVLAAVDRIEAAANPRAYLFRIAHNVAVDHIAKESRWRRVELDTDAAERFVDASSDAGRSSDHARLLTAVRRLALPYRQVVVLLLEGLGPAEIADVLGIRSGTVRVRLNRAKTMLREVLTHD